MLFQVPITEFDIDASKFNFTWEERKHYRISLGYRKVTDLMFAMNPMYIEAFNNACIDSRFSGGIHGQVIICILNYVIRLEKITLILC